MTDNNSRTDSMNQHDVENDKLDGDLNAALAKFAAAEPRTGLEERILATLRAEGKRDATRSGLHWPVVATLAALVFSVFIAVRSGKPVQTTAAHPRATTQNTGHAGTQVASNIGGSPIRPHKAVKLDQLSSPQPLSEQEKILARYVTKYPEHAALIAQARTEELQRDRAEEKGEAAHGRDDDLQQSNK